jgi:hypothetical protein
VKIVDLVNYWYHERGAEACEQGDLF